MTRRRVQAVIHVLVALFLLPVFLAGQSIPQPDPANLAARRWFQDAKFGLFIHWGVYSVLGDGEWVMKNKKMPIAEYEKLPPQFNPRAFNAAEWVSARQGCGHEVHHHYQQAS